VKRSPKKFSSSPASLRSWLAKTARNPSGSPPVPFSSPPFRCGKPPDQSQEIRRKGQSPLSSPLFSPVKSDVHLGPVVSAPPENVNITRAQRAAPHVKKGVSRPHRPESDPGLPAARFRCHQEVKEELGIPKVSRSGKEVIGDAGGNSLLQAATIPANDVSNGMTEIFV
jgi:hypothetical protein